MDQMLFFRAPVDELVDARDDEAVLEPVVEESLDCGELGHVQFPQALSSGRTHARSPFLHT